MDELQTGRGASPPVEPDQSHSIRGRKRAAPGSEPGQRVKSERRSVGGGGSQSTLGGRAGGFAEMLLDVRL